MEGVKKKLLGQGLEEFLNECDIVCFAETWLREGEELEIPDFLGTSKGSRTRGRRGRWPVGVSIMHRDRWKGIIRNVNINLEGVVGNLMKLGDLLVSVICVYKQPSTSRYVNPSFFADLAEELVKLQDEVPEAELLVVGDFNARVGEEDITLNGGAEGEGEVRRVGRRSKDKTLTGEGREFLAFCDSFGFEILNGKYGRDIEGNLTFINANGGSVIDFAVCSPNLLEHIGDF